ncbi:MAG: hypothetical protein K2M17_04860 [Bacilli bacterium]|nr:hypothetical protein [Bacilli bacterium]
MVCNRCGKPLPNEGAICKFCGAMMTQTQLKQMQSMQDSRGSFKRNLLSDRYGVDKSVLYQEKEEKKPKENKLLGAIIILGIIVFLIILTILMNIGK